jgi:hypothetical protein
MSFRFRLERPDGTPAEPPSVTVAVPNMRPGDTIPLGTARMLRVVQVQAPRRDRGTPSERSARTRNATRRCSRRCLSVATTPLPARRLVRRNLTALA